MPLFRCSCLVRYIGLLALALSCSSADCQTPSPAPKVAPPPSAKPTDGDAVAASFGASLIAECDAVIGSLKAGAKPSDLVPRVRVLLDLAVAYAQPGRDGPAIVRVAALHRLVGLLAELKSVPKAARDALLANPDLAQTLALAIQPEDQPEKVLGMLARVVTERPKLVADDAKLAGVIAAICVVYDKPPQHPTLGKMSTPIADHSDSPAARRSSGPIMSPTAPTIDPIDVLDHLASIRGRSVFPLERLPVELLVHVVDAKVTPVEQDWAFKAYPGNRTPGMLYDTITYDTASFKYNTPKKIFTEPGGYTLANIKKVGGVCAEQALFASEVGKALGVPSAFVFTRGSTVAHAYVGYLKQQGGTTVWDFSEGRFGEYDDLRGMVICPQTGRLIDTGTLGLTAIWGNDAQGDRELTSAMTILSIRVGELVGGTTEYPPVPPEAMRASTPAKGFRTASIKTQMELLRAGVAKSWAYEPAWRVAMTAAAAGVLDGNERGVWMKAAMTQCARSAPDFALAVASAMIAPSPAAEQSPQWDALAQQLNRRSDLVAAIRFRQADAWEKADQPAKAWAGYKDVIVRYPNDGTSVVESLAKAEQLLAAHGKGENALDLYKDAFRRISKPKKLSTESMVQSNYFRVGTRYASLLNTAGRKSEAEQVLRQIGVEDIAQRNR